MINMNLERPDKVYLSPNVAFLLFVEISIFSEKCQNDNIRFHIDNEILMYIKLFIW